MRKTSNNLLNMKPVLASLALLLLGGLAACDKGDEAEEETTEEAVEEGSGEEVAESDAGEDGEDIDEDAAEEIEAAAVEPSVIPSGLELRPVEMRLPTQTGPRGPGQFTIPTRNTPTLVVPQLRNSIEQVEP